MISQEEYIFLDSFFERNQLDTEYTVFKSENSASLEEFIKSFIEAYYFDKQANFPDFLLQLLKENEKEFLNFLIDNSKGNLKSDFYNYLVEKAYPLLVECIEERKILSAALKKIERQNLRMRFQQMDENEVDFLQEIEIKKALATIERQNLKSHFEELDQIELGEKAINSNVRYSMIGNISAHHQRDTSVKNISIILRMVKYAAILVVLILPVYLIFNLFAEKPKISKKPDQDKPKKELNDSLKLDSIPSFDLKEETYLADIKVAKEQSFGFAQREETIKLKVHFLNVKAQQKKIEDLQVTLNDLQTNYTETFSGKAGKGAKDVDYQLKIKELQAKIDKAYTVLKKHNNSYKFDEVGGICELFLNQNFISKNTNNFKVLKLDMGDANSVYFLRVKTTYFTLIPSKKMKQLTYVTDNDLIERLEDFE